MRDSFKVFICATACVALGACSDNSTPTSPTPPPQAPAPAAPGVTRVTVSGTTSFNERGATAQWTAIVTLSNGSTEDRTGTAHWLSDNSNVAAVSPLGVVTAQSAGNAFVSAVVSDIRGGRAITVRSSSGSGRPADPPPGQRVPMPDIRAFLEQTANAQAELLLDYSCPRGLKYVTNPWLDYMIDRLRTLDTRWGYNGKPNRSAADNSGVPVVAAGDEIAYHFGAGPDEGSPDVYLIDILLGHCGSTPSLTYRVFTGEEPGRWTGAGRF